MNENPSANGSRSPDPYARFRTVALAAAVAGVVVLAAAAFVLSYGGIHQLALDSGASPAMARVYPVTFDAVLVVASAAVLSLRGAGWWRRGFSWMATLVLLAAVALGDAVQATGVHLPRRPAAATMAVLPWVLLLLAFSLLLSMLRHVRHTRAALATAASVPAGPAALAEVTTHRDGMARAEAAPRAELDALLSRDSTPPLSRRGQTVEVILPRSADGPRSALPQPDAEPAKPATSAPAAGPVTTQPAVILTGIARPATAGSEAAPPGPALPVPDGEDAGQDAAVPASQPGTSQPETSAVQAPVPQAPEPEPAEPHAPEPQPAEPEPAEPEPGEPHAAGPEPTGPPADQPETSALQPAQPEPGPGAQPPGPVTGGTIHVPHQPIRAPVPAPSPHFDRLHSTPTPPEDEAESGS